MNIERHQQAYLRPVEMMETAPHGLIQQQLPLVLGFVSIWS